MYSYKKLKKPIFDFKFICKIVIYFPLENFKSNIGIFRNILKNLDN
jgi:hypothetical protein